LIARAWGLQLSSEERLKSLSATVDALGKAFVNVKLPRFRFEDQVELSHILKEEMGVTDAFSADKADFSAMLSHPDSRDQPSSVPYVLPRTHAHTHARTHACTHALMRLHLDCG
jgi:hypothetical protein